MLRTLALRSAALALLTVSPALAQHAGTVEFGGFFRKGFFDYLDNDPGIKTGQGFGGRLGIFVIRNLEVEGSAAYVYAENKTTSVSVSHVPIRGGLTYNLPAGEHASILLGGSYVYNRYRKSLVGHDHGFGGHAGLRLGLGETVSIRIQGTADRISDPIPPTVEEHWNFGAEAGLSFLFGPREHRAPPVVVAPAPSPKDTDSDGVLDTVDQCPDTPRGDAVDVNGCSLPKDSDGDGVFDAADQCPNTPKGDAVDATGCTVQKDSDGDGVYDTVDQCPDTPKGDFVSANGCSIPKDSDGDGVTDDKDRCPGTTGGTDVDARGCPLIALFAPGSKAVVLQGVNFETGKAILLPESQEILDQVAAALVSNADIRVEVQGHTDSRGSAALNARLSQARAEAVRQYLVDHGVAAERMIAKGYGPSQPLAPNTTADGRAQNRRVQLVKLN